MSNNKKDSTPNPTPKITVPPTLSLPKKMENRVTCGKKDGGEAFKSIKYIKGKE